MAAARAVAAAALAAAALPLALALAARARFAIDEAPGLSPDGASAAIARLRAAAGGDAAAAGDAAPDALPDAARPAPGRMWVTFRRRGEVAWRRAFAGATFGGQLEEAAAAVARDRPAGLIGIDLVIGRGRLPASPAALRAVAFVPAVEGLAIGDRALLPDDLVREGLLEKFTPIPRLRDLKVGVDVRAAIDRLRAAGAPADAPVERLRVQTWIEGPDGALPVARASTPPPPVTRAAALDAAFAAGRYAARQLGRQGRFVYLYDPFRDLASGGGTYSLPRHAGTTFFLGLLAGTQRGDEFRAPALAAAGTLARLARRAGGIAVVADQRVATLGSTALALAALVEVEESTGDRRHSGLARAMGRFLTAMQQPDGGFFHRYDTRARRPVAGPKLLYYSGEAAFALARLHRLTGDAALVDPVRRALHDQAVREYDSVAGQLYVGEDHWTCYAAEAAYPAVDDPRFARHCRAFVEFNRLQQVRPGDPGSAGLHGAYTPSVLVVPHHTPAASRTEAAIACHRLLRARGEPAEDIADQVRLTLGYLLRHQIRPGNDWLYARPERAWGAWRQSAIATDVRIDFVQHAGAALARGAELLR